MNSERQAYQGNDENKRQGGEAPRHPEDAVGTAPSPIVETADSHLEEVRQIVPSVGAGEEVIFQATTPEHLDPGAGHDVGLPETLDPAANSVVIEIIDVGMREREQQESAQVADRSRGRYQRVKEAALTGDVNAIQRYERLKEQNRLSHRRWRQRNPEKVQAENRQNYQRRRSLIE